MSKNKKVLMIVYAIFNTDNRVTRTCQVLLDNNYEVDVISLKETTNGKLKVNLFNSCVKKYRGRSQLLYIFSYCLFFLNAFIYSSILSFKNRYSVVHVHNMPDFLVFASIVPKLLGAKVILDVHDSTREVYMAKFKTKLLEKPLRFEEKISYHFADCLFTVNDIYVGKIKNVLNNRKKSIISILNLPSFKSIATKESDLFTVVHHGAITYRHGSDLLVRGFAAASSQMPKAKLKIFGIGDHSKMLKNVIHEVADNKIQLINEQFDHYDIPKLVGDASVGVVPMRPGPFIDNCLPVKMLEYLTLGIPVLVTEIKILNYGFNQYVIRLDKNDIIASISKELLLLYKNKKLYKKYRDIAETFTHEFSWQYECKKITDWYEIIASCKQNSSEDGPLHQ